MSSTRKGRHIDIALRSKGFWRDSSGDHIYYFFGDTHIKTKMSHGTSGDSLGVQLISAMAKQLHLTKKQFLELIDCPLDEKGYREILRDKGFEV